MRDLLVPLTSDASWYKIFWDKIIDGLVSAVIVSLYWMPSSTVEWLLWYLVWPFSIVALFYSFQKICDGVSILMEEHGTRFNYLI